jgi:hypothetical protein
LELDFLSYREETVASLPKVQNKDDIPEPWQNSPIGPLLQYHNLGRPPDPCEKPELLVSMCMDKQKELENSGQIRLHHKNRRCGDEVDFLLREVERLRLRYPKVQVAPLMYNVDDHLLYLVEER